MKFRKLILPVASFTAINIAMLCFANNDDYNFKNFGEIKLDRNYEIKAIGIGDFNGDGPLDIAVGVYDKSRFESKIILYENKITQKANK